MWDLKEIEYMHEDMSADLVVVISEKMKNLSELTQHVLKVSGNRDLSTSATLDHSPHLEM